MDPARLLFAEEYDTREASVALYEVQIEDNTITPFNPSNLHRRNVST
jgi:hypothetical protein